MNGRKLIFACQFIKNWQHLTLLCLMLVVSFAWPLATLCEKDICWAIAYVEAVNASSPIFTLFHFAVWHVSYFLEKTSQISFLKVSHDDRHVIWKQMLTRRVSSEHLFTSRIFLCALVCLFESPGHLEELVTKYCCLRTSCLLWLPCLGLLFPLIPALNTSEKNTLNVVWTCHGFVAYAEHKQHRLEKIVKSDTFNTFSFTTLKLADSYF